jgi:flagellin
MGLRINQNIMAYSAYRNLTVTDGQLAKSLEKLSSGFRINRAADDAAGLVISENLRAQVNGLRVATRNAQDGISVVQTAEGALQEVHSILQRMRDLAVQAANTGSADTVSLNAAQSEVTALAAELDRIASATKFGTKALLDGTFGESAVTTGANVDVSVGTPFVVGATTDELTIQIGSTTANVTIANASYTSAADLQTALVTATRAGLTAAGLDPNAVSVTVNDADNDGVAQIKFQSSAAFTLGNGGADTTLTNLAVPAGLVSVTGSGGVFQIGANAGETITVSIAGVSASILGVNALDVVNSASAAITAADSAVSSVSNQRSSLGALQNRFEHTIANLNVATENLAASESRIRDTDMALEMVQFTRHQILLQAGTAMLAQANVAPQNVLSLLQQ